MPYVRKSFYKHYKDGIKFVENIANWDGINVEPSELSIDDTEYTKHERAYDYALKMTEREVKQAVEGLYHNLNSLQSRSGNQLN